MDYVCTCSSSSRSWIYYHIQSWLSNMHADSSFGFLNFRECGSQKNLQNVVSLYILTSVCS
jgi:hypothetical protein